MRFDVVEDVESDYPQEEDHEQRAQDRQRPRCMLGLRPLEAGHAVGDRFDPGHRGAAGSESGEDKEWRQRRRRWEGWIVSGHRSVAEQSARQPDDDEQEHCRDEQVGGPGEDRPRLPRAAQVCDDQ